MTTTIESVRESAPGLGLLVLLVVALVASETRTEVFAATDPGAAPDDGLMLIIDQPPSLRHDVVGTIRELQVRPLGSRPWPDLNWRTDEPASDERRGLGF